MLFFAVSSSVYCGRDGSIWAGCWKGGSGLLGRRIFHRISYFEGEVGVYGGFFMGSSVFKAQGLFDGLF